jgi:hypothetical protein
MPRDSTKDLDSPQLNLQADGTDSNKNGSPPVQVLQRERQAGMRMLFFAQFDVHKPVGLFELNLTKIFNNTFLRRLNTLHLEQSASFNA